MSAVLAGGGRVVVRSAEEMLACLDVWAFLEQGA
jgi:hypothetical protein